MDGRHVLSATAGNRLLMVAVRAVRRFGDALKSSMQLAHVFSQAASACVHLFKSISSLLFCHDRDLSFPLRSSVDQVTVHFFPSHSYSLHIYSSSAPALLLVVSESCQRSLLPRADAASRALVFGQPAVWQSI